MNDHSKFRISATCLVVLTILLGSCSSILFENPVPQKADELKVIPDYLSGLYEATESDGAEKSDEIFLDLLRLERLNDHKLLATAMRGFRREDLPKFEKLLAEDKQKGEILDYFVTASQAYYTLKQDQSDASEQKRGGHFVTFEAVGDYLLFPQSKEMLFSFDLAAGKQILFEKAQSSSSTNSPYFKTATDSLTATERIMVTKGEKDEIWFSMKNEESRWSLIYIKRLSDTELLVKHSEIGEKADLKQSLDRYNAITPFKKEGDSNNYLINPTDAQLKKLLADPHLFSSMKLKKLPF
ncbi:MAG: hypothetical protein SH848_03380 [Saprospiraceae bacterium]|nr:hypothetical protein [Saprospiraceae bacterium]